MDIEPLLSPISAELPCGPDADEFEEQKSLYEAFSQLKAKLEGEMKNGVLQPPKWPEIQEAALSLAASTKHLHLGAILAESGLMNEGFAGFRDGLRLIHFWCRDFWPHLYPREVRHTLIDSLSSPRFILKPMRVQIARAEGGSFSFEDYEKAVEEKQSPDNDIANHGRLVLGVFQATPREQHLNNLAIIEDALSHVNAIEEISYELGGSAEAMNLVKLRELLERMIDALKPLSAEAEAVAGEGESSAVQPTGGMSAATGPGFGGAIASRAQAAQQLEQIAQFFEKSEPSSPLPYMLRRASRCIGKNFMDLLDELATTKEHATQVLSPITEVQDS